MSREHPASLSPHPSAESHPHHFVSHLDKTSHNKAPRSASAAMQLKASAIERQCVFINYDDAGQHPGKHPETSHRGQCTK